MILESNPMLRLIEMVTRVMQNNRERDRQQEEDANEGCQNSRQNWKPEELSMAQRDYDRSFEESPALFEFSGHKGQVFFSRMKVKSSLSVRPLLAASANSRLYRFRNAAFFSLAPGVNARGWA